MRHAGGVLSASALNSGIAFAVTVAAATLLPLAAFGTLALSLALVVLLAALTDAGTGLALVRQVGRDPASGRAAATAVVGWKLLCAAALPAIGLWLPQAAVAELLPLLADDRALFATTLAAAGLLGLWSSARTIDQAHEDFAALDRALLACAVLRAATFALLVVADALTPLTVLASLYVVPLALLLALRVRRAAHAAAWPGARRAGLALARYGAWVGASTACFVAFTRMPALIVGHAGDADALGVLGGALTLTLGCALLGDALRTVALPRIVRARDGLERAAVRAWLRRTARPILLLGALGTLVIAAAYESVLGPAHAGGATLLLILGPATLLAADLGLHNALLHAHGRPQLDLRVNALRLLALALLAALLPPTPLAIAIAYAAVLVGGELALHVAVRRLEHGGVARLAAEPSP